MIIGAGYAIVIVPPPREVQLRRHGGWHAVGDAERGGCRTSFMISGMACFCSVAAFLAPNE